MAKRIAAEDGYPLLWPDGRERCGYRRQRIARFDCKFSTARDHLLRELKLLGARYVVISTNVPLKQDGYPYAGQRQPDDTGVAVYFDYGGSAHVFACDKWRKVEHNLRAIGKTIEALRGIARWGSGDMMKQAIGAFKSLPATGGDWRIVLKVPASEMRLPVIQEAYRAAAMEAHPDRGGDANRMIRVNQAWEAAQKALL